jgi:hypothetical protein
MTGLQRFDFGTAALLQDNFGGDTDASGDEFDAIWERLARKMPAPTCPATVTSLLEYRARRQHS